MQDRFKFRVWSKDTNKMYNVYSLHIGINKAIISSRRGNVSIYINKNNILMQSTGLKDKNGKLVYKGDIVRSNEYPFMNKEQDNYYAEICWDDESGAFFYYTFKNPKFNDVCGLSTGNTGNLNEYEWEVIGNIYENPELLKE